jgi:hypothetical protein
MEVSMPVNDAYLVQVEGWRGAVRQAPAAQEAPAAPKAAAAQILPPIVRMTVQVLDKVGRRAA